MTTIELIGGDGNASPSFAPIESSAQVPVSVDGALLGALEACEQQRLKYEASVGFDEILDAMARFVAPDRVTLGIDSYRTVIRANDWLYPKVIGPMGNVATFFQVWTDVHTDYFALATEIFEKVTTGDPDLLVDHTLYGKVIASETSRGWVGKRSPIGPDLQTVDREVRLEAVLADHLDDDEIDNLLTIGGLMPVTRVLRTAEMDMTALLTTLATSEPGIEAFAVARTRMLRDYTKYSEYDLESKLAAFVPHADVAHMAAASVSVSRELDDLLDRLPHSVRATVVELLADIRALNFLNLNLEPRFSFKSWAGLMHGLVFAAVRDHPGMSDDIYRNLTNLKETQ